MDGPKLLILGCCVTMSLCAFLGSRGNRRRGASQTGVRDYYDDDDDHIPYQEPQPDDVNAAKRKKNLKSKNAGKAKQGAEEKDGVRSDNAASNTSTEDSATDGENKNDNNNDKGRVFSAEFLRILASKLLKQRKQTNKEDDDNKEDNNNLGLGQYIGFELLGAGMGFPAKKAEADDNDDDDDAAAEHPVVSARERFPSIDFADRIDREANS